MSQTENMKELSRQVVDRLLAGEKEVKLPGLGSFKMSYKEARTARNPATGESVQVPAKTTVKFTVGDKLKDLVKDVELVD